jgi:DNA-binding MarR family transcriptional regulator/GNAT superfamily N-acetyltransferase
MKRQSLTQRIDSVRSFNRFYTRQIGVLQEGLLDSQFSLAEVRVLYELAHSDRPTAAKLSNELGLDAGYVSRILKGFERLSFLQKATSASDGRENLLTLTPQGHQALAPLEARSREQIGGMLKKLSEGGQARLIAAIETVQSLLGDRKEAASGAPYVLRPPESGDMGWVVHRHGALYANEYGYDETFEALVAEIVAKFVQDYDSRRERCWIAERNGEIVGSVFLVRGSKAVAKLRLLFVEPAARGLGIGARLVAQCVRFARQAGYKKVVLWTQSELMAARHVYKNAGFRVTHRKRHHSFGKDLVAETWELAL